MLSGLAAKLLQVFISSFKNPQQSSWNIMASSQEMDETYIKAALQNLGIPKLRPLQKLSFEVIGKGHNTVLVSERKSGKTLGYVLPIMMELAKFAEENMNNPTPGHGPLAMIVCDSYNDCVTLEAMCKIYASIGRRSGRTLRARTKVVGIYTGNGEKAKFAKLIAGTELLICTVYLLEHLLQLKNFTYLDRVKWIVYDQFEKLSSEPFTAPFRAVHMRFMNFKVQFIVAAEMVTEDLEEFLDRLEEWKVVIGAKGGATVHDRSRRVR